MKLYLPFLLFSILFASCKNDANEIPVTSFEDEMEMKKWDSIYTKFQTFEIKLYNKSSKKPKFVLSEIDSLFTEYKDDQNIKSDLHYFKAEIFYNLGEYKKSIKELQFENSGETDIALVCNYIKLKKFEKAKLILDSISKKDIGFEDFIYGNYYEVLNKRNQAMDLYRNIQEDKSLKRFFFYQLAIDRINELDKKEPKLLNEIYFPTGNPDFKENVN